MSVLFEVFNYYTVEGLLMRWLKKDLWKAGIAIVGMLLFLLLTVGVPVSAAGADEGASGLATPVTETVQATPTEDATVTALNKEKLAQEVQQLKNQNTPDPFGWLRTNASIFLSTLVVVIGALFGFWQWSMGRRDAQNKELKDRQAEREKRDEDRFQTAVLGLGKDDTKIGATVILRTFLQGGYEKFYPQIFDLAVIYLRLRVVKLDDPPDDPDGFSQALFTVFKDSYLQARNLLGPNPRREDYASLDGSFIHLDRAYLARCDLKNARMRTATFRGATFYQANLHGANLYDADFSSLSQSEKLKGPRGRQTYLGWADLSGTDLRFAKLIEANLTRAKLIKADLRGADLSKADLIGTNLSGADLSKANLSGAIFKEYCSPKKKIIKADLSGANLSGADLTGTHLEDALSLEDTNLRGVKGLTKEQEEACKAKGAIIDEVPVTGSSQATVSPPLSPQSNDTPVQSATSAQGGIPPPDTGGSSAASSSQTRGEA
jgi:uncharacterized protein YjbI with pentapeptide repeats